MVGDFNGWDGRAHPMRSLGSTGVWELFVPDVGAGTRYKFEILGRDGVWRQKADPMARCTEVAAGDRVGRLRARRTTGTTTSGWRARGRSQPHAEPMSVYEVHLGSWRPGPSATASSPTS